MISEAYAIGDSCFHRLDPRVKVIAATLYALLVASASRFSTLGAALVVSSILLVLTRLPLQPLLSEFSWSTAS